VVALAVSKLRKRWYGNYLNALKNAVNSLLYRIDEIQFEKEEAYETDGDAVSDAGAQTTQAT
jgi:hypothetical protein